MVVSVEKIAKLDVLVFALSHNILILSTFIFLAV
jgi:hypothetical protein